jgi:hypothetical protein
MTKATVKNKGGRPTDYKEEYNDQVRKLCLLGATDESLANFFNIAVSTLNLWKDKHPKFMESIREGKEVADANVADALYNRAIGFSHKHDHISNFQGDITITPTIKHYPADTGAAFIWLKNRRNKHSDGWKDKQEVEHSGEVVTFNMDFGDKK